MARRSPRFRRLQQLEVAPRVLAPTVVVSPHTDLDPAGEHADDPTAWVNYHDWYVDRDSIVRRDSLGRFRANSWGPRWLVVRCNNPDCAGRVDVREDALGHLADWALREHQSEPDV